MSQPPVSSSASCAGAFARLQRPRRKHDRTTTQRGYGGEHQALRDQYAPAVDAGHECCRRCGVLIAPLGLPCPRCGKVRCRWDLGHSDFDRGVYTGPEHRCCNRATAGRRRRKRKTRPTSREW